METKKIAVIVKGYYREITNTVFSIYILNEKKQLLIPCDEVFGTEVETSDALADIVNELKKGGYKVTYDIREETFFDVNQFYPSHINEKPIPETNKERKLQTQKMLGRDICLN
jgi:hypothetical protein